MQTFLITFENNVNSKSLGHELVSIWRTIRIPGTKTIRQVYPSGCLSCRVLEEGEDAAGATDTDVPFLYTAFLW